MEQNFTPNHVLRSAAGPKPIYKIPVYNLVNAVEVINATKIFSIQKLAVIRGPGFEPATQTKPKSSLDIRVRARDPESSGFSRSAQIIMPRNLSAANNPDGILEPLD